MNKCYLFANHRLSLEELLVDGRTKYPRCQVPRRHAGLVDRRLDVPRLPDGATAGGAVQPGCLLPGRPVLCPGDFGNRPGRPLRRAGPMDASVVKSAGNLQELTPRPAAGGEGFTFRARRRAPNANIGAKRKRPQKTPMITPLLSRMNSGGGRSPAVPVSAGAFRSLRIVEPVGALKPPIRENCVVARGTSLR